jgi:hypothetical protein
MHRFQRSSLHARALPRVAAALGSALLAMLALAPDIPAEAAAAPALPLVKGKVTSATIGQPFGNGTGSMSFVVPAAAARPIYLGLQFRSASIGTGYRTRVAVLADGTVKVGFSRVVGGKDTALVSKPNGMKARAGSVIHFEASVQGTSPVVLSVRAWVDKAAKPGWQRSYSDSSAQRVTTSGAVRAWAYQSTRATRSASLGLRSVSAAATATTTSGGSILSAGKPNSNTTGVRAGTALKAHYGDITVTRSGTVLDRMDIHGFVNVKAANVRITNSIVRGGVAKNSVGIITNYGHANLLVENVTLVADHPTVYLDGLKGNNFTARRIHVVGNTDSVKIHGDNVTVENSLLENTHYWAHDPAQGGGPSHSDNVQILYGKNIVIQNNTIRGATNFAVLGAANSANVPNLVVRNNWLDGGWCTLKLQVLHGHSLTATAVNNKFGPNRKVKSCPFQAEPAVHLTASRNVYESNGLAVPILRVNS